MQTSSNTKGRACITGASAGIGESFARQLAQHGYDLLLVARRRERLQSLSDELAQAHGVSAQIAIADLSKPDDLHAFADQLAQDASLRMLVNNAGFGNVEALAQTDADLIEEMIALNVTALARLTRAVLPGFLSRNAGAIINVSSGLAFFPIPNGATYSGTKAFVNNFTEAIAVEVKDTNVRVQCLCPGVTRTKFHDRSGSDLSKMPAETIMDADPLVAASLIALERGGEVVCIPGLHEAARLEAFGTARAAVMAGLRNSTVAARYESTD